MLTTFAGMREDIRRQCESMRELARAGISALVIFQRERHAITKQLEPALITTADEVGLPLIVMVDSEEMDYAQIIEDVMEQVLYGNNFKNSLINNTIFHLLNFEKHASFQQALREAAVNNDFQVVLLSEEFNPVLAVETRHQTTISEAIQRGRQVALNLSNIYSLIDIDGVLTYWGFDLYQE